MSEREDELAKKLRNCVYALTYCINELERLDPGDPLIAKVRVTRDRSQEMLVKSDAKAGA